MSVVTSAELRELAASARQRSGSIRLSARGQSRSVPWSQVAAELEGYASARPSYELEEGGELATVLAQIRQGLASSSSSAPAAQTDAQLRAEYERAGRAVQRFVAVGVMPLIAAGAANDAGAWPGVIALWANPISRAAIEGVDRDVRAAYDRARATWESGDHVRGRNEMVVCAQALARFGNWLLQVAPAAGAHLRSVVGRTAWSVVTDLAELPGRIADGIGGAAKAIGYGLGLLGVLWLVGKAKK